LQAYNGAHESAERSASVTPGCQRSAHQRQRLEFPALERAWTRGRGWPHQGLATFVGRSLASCMHHSGWPMDSSLQALSAPLYRRTLSPSSQPSTATTPVPLRANQATAAAHWPISFGSSRQSKPLAC